MEFERMPTDFMSMRTNHNYGLPGAPKFCSAFL